VTSFPDKIWCVKTHSRLVGEDPTASAELYKAIFSPLVGWLGAKYRTTDRELIRDAATDALVDYIKRPKRWDPKKGTLVAYICMAADRDLLNALEKVQRLRKHEVLSADVEHEEFDRNVLPEDVGPSDAMARLLCALDRKVTSETDRLFVTLMLEGERSTSKFAEVLGIQDLPKQEKARTVKQHKDRLKKVIERLRSQLNAR
jgi:RNA polymerase sigma-70 factor (ECF subfamily)